MGSRVALLPLALALLGLLPPAVSAQDEVSVDEVALELAGTIQDGLKEDRLQRVETALRSLDGIYADVSAKPRKKVDKALLAVFKHKPPRPEFDGQDTRDTIIDMVLLTVGLLYDEEGGPALLQQALKVKHVKDWRPVESAIVEGLGYRQDPKLVGLLTGYLQDEDPVVCGSAATALGQYGNQDMKQRRAIVRHILEAWETFAEAADKEQRRKKESTVARDAVADVEGPFINALVRLTRKEFGDLASWRGWFDEHGAGKDW